MPVSKVIISCFKNMRSAIVVLVVLVAVYFFYGYIKNTVKGQKALLTLTYYLLAPSDAFDPENMVDQLDYSKTESWLSLPERNDEADLIPAGIGTSINDGEAPVDVFFIHPTGYMNNVRWTSPVHLGTATEDNAKFALANQASVFNGCCNIYAPHYREASIFIYLSPDPVVRDKILDAVYPDISSAFEYFIQHYNNGRPFVIVGHSQGTHLAMRLLHELDQAPHIANRMVAAYLIGSLGVSLTEDYVDSLDQFSVCKKSTDTQCLIHWDTYGENSTGKVFGVSEQSICINPLSWNNAGSKVSAEFHFGAVPASGMFTGKMLGDDASENILFEIPGEPMKAHTWAQCRDGLLYVANQENTVYKHLVSLPGKSYHGIDFSLFYMNIRENIATRIAEYYGQ